MPIGPLVPGTPTTVTPDASPPLYTSTQGPAPDGPVVADDVLAAHLIALNIQQNLNTRLVTVENNIPGISTLSTPRIYPPISSGYGGATDWAVGGDAATGARFWTQTANSTLPVLCELSPSLPLSGRLLSIGMRLQPASGHGGLPAVFPTATLCLISRANFATAVDILTATQSAATVPAYEGDVFFEATLGTAHLIDHSYLYYVRFTGESGANYVGGLRVYGIELRVTP